VKIPRLFTSAVRDPYHGLEFEAHTSEIRDPNGKVIFHCDDVVVPTTWSQIATDILAQKYFRKTGVPQADGSEGSETDARQVFHRLAHTWADWGKRHGYFTSQADAEAFYDELRYMLARQMAAPNSPQWFNTGLYAAYGIEGPPQGHYYVEPSTGEVRESTSAYEHPQPHACFILNVTDDLVNEDGIMDLVTREARLFKYGSGTGTNYSRIRGKGEPLSGGGVSSGLLSFIKVGDKSASAVKSGGTTRRAARMVTLDADHPDIEEYVDWKVREEHKVAALVTGSRTLRKHARCILESVRAAGAREDRARFDPRRNPALAAAIAAALRDEVPRPFLFQTLQLAMQGQEPLEVEEMDLGWEGEAYATVSGQTSNNSVRLDARFMQGVLEDGVWPVVYRVSGKVKKEVRARELWDRIALAAWMCADPGVQFHSTINEWHTCANDGEIRASNPCVTGDTLVATAVGFRRIDSLLGQAVTIVGGNGNPAPIDGAFKTGTKPVYELRTLSGFRLRLTGDHKVSTANRGDVPARELTVEDHVLLESPGFGSVSVPEHFGVVLGAAVGDGCIRSEPEVAEEIQGHLAACKEWLYEGDRRAVRATNVVRTKTSLRVATAVRSVVDRLSEYAVLDEGSENKAFTDAIYGLDRESLAAVLRGLFTTDGTVDNYGGGRPYVSLDSTSLLLLRQVQLLLLSFGIKGKLYENRRPPGQTTYSLPDAHGDLATYPVRQRHSLRITCSSRRVFEHLVGFLTSSDKARKLSEGNATFGIQPESMTDRVASRTPCGVEDVYDLTEPESHHFVANGIVVSNCSEYLFLDDTACNLASLNLLTFYDRAARRFDLEAYRHAVRLWTVVLEISVLMAQFPSRSIARKSYDYRTLGLGFANLGTLLMVMGIPYDSDRGRAIGGALAAIMTGEGYAASAEMARELGPFARYAANRDGMLRVIRNHRRAAYHVPVAEYEGLSVAPDGLDETACPPEMLEAAREAWDRALALGEAHGYRNAQLSAVAPTGTIGLIMDCDTTGIEPDFALVKFKKLAGGGYFKIINASVPAALAALGYTEEQVDDIVHYCTGRGTLVGAPGVNHESLRARGFTDSILTRVEQAVRDAFSVRDVFSPYVVDRTFLTKTLGVSEQELESADFDLLKHLGFSEEEIEATEVYATGTMTIEGAPHLKREHYPVFDTATRAGRRGTRSIPWTAHIGIMGSVQPFVSGSISKTINMPNNAKVEDIKGAYMLSWRHGVKSMALYRDGSKLSQPLSSLAGTEEPEYAPLLEALRGPSAPPEVPVAGPAPRRRRTLPNRRRGYTQKVKIGAHSLFLRTGEYPEGGLGEVFIDMYKEGAAFRSLLNAFARSVSIGLQYGVPLDKYVDAFIFSRFEPNGMVQGHDRIKMTTSVIDYIFRDLALNYLGRTDLVQVNPTDLLSTGTSSEVGRDGDEPEPNGNGAAKGAASPVAVTRSRNGRADPAAIARLKGYEGDPCPVCGNFTLLRGGTCMKCETCGSTTGCS
jgi:ribonucleoside-diphosphate reductase alpha chain